MSRVEKVLRDLSDALTTQRQRFALVGGLAVSARAEPRFTRDVDVAVAAADDSVAEMLVYQLVNLGYVVLMAVEQDAAKRLATVRMLPPRQSRQSVVADLLFASSGIEDRLVDSAEAIEILPGFTVPVATVGHLLALKVLSLAPDRPQDLMDIRSLLAVASPSDLDHAHAALALIDERGFSRGKALLDELQRLALGFP